LTLHHLSQAELAELLGVARQTVHAIETGKFAPSLPLAFKIVATLFGADINDVFAPDRDETLPVLRERGTKGTEALAARRDEPRALVFLGRAGGPDGA
jgi:putative transcriptional regulator